MKLIIRKNLLKFSDLLDTEEDIISTGYEIIGPLHINLDTLQNLKHDNLCSVTDTLFISRAN